MTKKVSFIIGALVLIFVFGIVLSVLADPPDDPFPIISPDLFLRLDGTSVMAGDINAGGFDLFNATDVITTDVIANRVRFDESGTWKYQLGYDAIDDEFHLDTTDIDGGGTDASLWFINDGTNQIRFFSEIIFVNSSDTDTAHFLKNPGGNDLTIGTITNNNFEFQTGGTTRMTLVHPANLNFNQAMLISTFPSGTITINPTNGNIDVSGDPFLLQNVSQPGTPGTTVDGQIRLWEDSNAPGSPDGRIVAQINGTTFEWNADAGLSFINRPRKKELAEAYFLLANNAWKAAFTIERVIEYHAWYDANPDYIRPSLSPTIWSRTLYDEISAAYSQLQTDWDARVVTPLVKPDFPAIGSWDDLQASVPHPEPGSYAIPDATLNETLSAITGTQIREGAAVILRVDREVLDAQGNVVSIHMIPSLLVEEIKAAKDKLERFLDLDQGTAGNAPACIAANRGHFYLEHRGSGIADRLLLCAKTASDNYDWGVK